MDASTSNKFPYTHADLFNPTLTAIRELGGSASNDEITEAVIQLLNIPDEIVDIPHKRGNRSKLEYRLAWARSWLKIVNLIINSERGIWSFTNIGWETKKVDPKNVVSEVNRINRLKRSKQIDSSLDYANDDSITEFPIDPFSTDDNFDDSNWREKLMDILLRMQPSAFEKLCQRILRESGFTEVQVTGKPSDGGIDGHGILRLAGLIGFPVVFQCKRFSENSVGAKVVRDFRGAMVGRADKGLILTTSRFSKQAQEEAVREGAPQIDLLDGEDLIDKLYELRLGVKIKEMIKEEIEVDQTWFDSIQ